MSSNKSVLIPVSQNFSEMKFGEESYDLPTYEEDYSKIGIENTILSMLGDLSSDRERFVFLLLAMGQDGYDFSHKDIAAMLRIEYSWYMRIVRGIKKKLFKYNDEKIKKTGHNFKESMNSRSKNTKTA